MKRPDQTVLLVWLPLAVIVLFVGIDMMRTFSSQQWDAAGNEQAGRTKYVSDSNDTQAKDSVNPTKRKLIEPIASQNQTEKEQPQTAPVTPVIVNIENHDRAI